MLGSQMRLPGAGNPSPRHFLGAGPHDIETSIQNWRETFLNKYQDHTREVGVGVAPHQDIATHLNSAAISSAPLPGEL